MAANTTQKVIRKIAKMHDVETDYAIAKLLGCSHVTIGNYRKGKTMMDDTTCLQAANLIRIDPLMLMAKVRLERGVTPRERGVWERYAGRVLLACLILGSYGGVTPDTAFAQNPGSISGNNIYYTQCFAHRLRWLREACDRVFGWLGGSWFGRKEDWLPTAMVPAGGTL